MAEGLTKAEKKAARKVERQEWEQQLEQSANKQKIRKIALWVGIPLLIIGSVFGLYQLAASPSNTDSPTLTAPTVTSKDVIATGSPTAKNTLIEYADFQCPACDAYHPFVDQFMKDNGKTYRLIYRFFPLTQIHQNAMISARYGYAAYLQGKFWPMYNSLFDHQNEWATLTDPTPKFLSYAQSLELNVTKLQQDANASSTIQFINSEEDGGVQAGVNSTPTFFVNGKSVSGGASYAEFKQNMLNAGK